MLDLHFVAAEESHILIYNKKCFKKEDLSTEKLSPSKIQRVFLHHICPNIGRPRLGDEPNRVSALVHDKILVMI